MFFFLKGRDSKQRFNDLSDHCASLLIWITSTGLSLLITFISSFVTPCTPQAFECIYFFLKALIPGSEKLLNVKRINRLENIFSMFENHYMSKELK